MIFFLNYHADYIMQVEIDKKQHKLWQILWEN